VLDDLRRVDSAIPNGVKAPELLRAMAEENQTFFKDGQANAWVADYLKRRRNARH
jgi:hypothetical protein